MAVTTQSTRTEQLLDGRLYVPHVFDVLESVTSGGQDSTSFGPLIDTHLFNSVAIVITSTSVTNLVTISVLTGDTTDTLRNVNTVDGSTGVQISTASTRVQYGGLGRKTQIAINVANVGGSEVGGLLGTGEFT